MITEIMLRSAASDFQVVMGIDPPIKPDLEITELINLLKTIVNGKDEDGEPFIRPYDKFKEDTEKVIPVIADYEVNDIINMINAEIPEMTFETLYDNVYYSKDIKALKRICNKFDVFKSLQGNLGVYQDIELLRDEMIALLTIKAESTHPIPTKQGEFHSLLINQSFKNACPALSAEEFEALEQLILKDGKIIDPIQTWNGYIVDGHNRYAIAEKHNLPFDEVERQFKNEESVIVWIKENAIGQRNLSEFSRYELIKDLEVILKIEGKKRQVEANENQTDELLLQITKAEKHNTRQKLAKAAGMSESQIQKAREVDKVVDEETKEKLRKGELKIGTVHKEIIKKEIVATDKDRIEIAAKELDKWALKYNGSIYKEFVDKIIDITILMREKYN